MIRGKKLEATRLEAIRVGAVGSIRVQEFGIIIIYFFKELPAFGSRTRLATLRIEASAATWVERQKWTGLRLEAILFGAPTRFELKNFGR